MLTFKNLIPHSYLFNQLFLWDFLDERDNRWLYSLDDIDLVAFLSGSDDSDASEVDFFWNPLLVTCSSAKLTNFVWYHLKKHFSGWDMFLSPYCLSLKKKNSDGVTGYTVPWTTCCVSHVWPFIGLTDKCKVSYLMSLKALLLQLFHSWDLNLKRRAELLIIWLYMAMIL